MNVLFADVSLGPNAAKTAGELACVGCTFMHGPGPSLRSWMYIVGGEGEAESKIVPSCEIARIFGGEGWI
jgi:hypothetical protein